MKPATIFRLTTSLLVWTMLGTTALAFGPTEDIRSGKAVITLDPGFLSSIGLLGMDLTKIAPASYSAAKHTVTLSITGGAFDLSVAESDIITGGGFKLTKGGPTITLSDLIITLPDDPTRAEVSALVTTNGAYLGRHQLASFNSATLNLSTPLSLPSNKGIVVHGVPLILTPLAATLVNNALGLPGVFVGGSAIGLIEASIKVTGKIF